MADHQRVEIRSTVSGTGLEHPLYLSENKPKDLYFMISNSSPSVQVVFTREPNPGNAPDTLNYNHEDYLAWQRRGVSAGNTLQFLPHVYAFKLLNPPASTILTFLTAEPGVDSRRPLYPFTFNLPPGVHIDVVHDIYHPPLLGSKPDPRTLYDVKVAVSLGSVRFDKVKGAVIESHDVAAGNHKKIMGVGLLQALVGPDHAVGFGYAVQRPSAASKTPWF